MIKIILIMINLIMFDQLPYISSSSLNKSDKGRTETAARTGQRQPRREDKERGIGYKVTPGKRTTKTNPGGPKRYIPNYPSEPTMQVQNNPQPPCRYSLNHIRGNNKSKQQHDTDNTTDDDHPPTSSLRAGENEQANN